jgi:hypothetical protein
MQQPRLCGESYSNGCITPDMLLFCTFLLAMGAGDRLLTALQ